jgi:hypothetical protein
MCRRTDGAPIKAPASIKYSRVKPTMSRSKDTVLATSTWPHGPDWSTVKPYRASLPPTFTDLPTTRRVTHPLAPKVQPKDYAYPSKYPPTSSPTNTLRFMVRWLATCLLCSSIHFSGESEADTTQVALHFEPQVKFHGGGAANGHAVPVCVTQASSAADIIHAAVTALKASECEGGRCLCDTNKTSTCHDLSHTVDSTQSGVTHSSGSLDEGPQQTLAAQAVASRCQTRACVRQACTTHRAAHSVLGITSCPKARSP